MPVKKVAYSKAVKLPSGHKTLALYDDKNNLIEYRICKYDNKEKKFDCPIRKRHARERVELAKKIGINSRTNQLKKKK